MRPCLETLFGVGSTQMSSPYYDIKLDLGSFLLLVIFRNGNACIVSSTEIDISPPLAISSDHEVPTEYLQCALSAMLGNKRWDVEVNCNDNEKVRILVFKHDINIWLGVVIGGNSNPPRQEATEYLVQWNKESSIFNCMATKNTAWSSEDKSLTHLQGGSQACASHSPQCKTRSTWC